MSPFNTDLAGKHRDLAGKVNARCGGKFKDKKTCLIVEVGLAEAGLGLGEGLISLLGGVGGGLLLSKLVVRHPVFLGCSVTFLTDLYLEK
jgi:hypothetical protein